MSRARALTMGNGRHRRRQSTTGYAAKLARFTHAPAPDLDAFAALLDEVGRSPRALTFREGRALTAARARYAQLTDRPTQGPDDAWTPLPPRRDT